ncbi:MAG TPA: sigma-70 family RNA polymerase sigma factor [Saprospiraceae bacterium]|nr:sigma-70 family RNA polymerase sigma factor [Saprospiraceae bacterium]HPI07795.1 sigma-70 family RNA polymerase sigma factor [Saprospiraceae bacterium]
MTESNADIFALVTGCIRRQPASQKELVRRYAATLLSVIRRYARNSADADDILQECFILVFKKIDTYDASRGSLPGWLRKIAVNCALMHYRNMRFSQEKATEFPPENIDVSADIFSKMGFEEILALVNTLPDGAREVFNMAVFDDFSHDEIAAALNIPAGTSRSLLSRARRLLQEKILKMQSNELARI